MSGLMVTVAAGRRQYETRTTGVAHLYRATQYYDSWPFDHDSRVPYGSKSRRRTETFKTLEPVRQRLARANGAAIKSQKEIDVPGALATAACHVWPGHEDHVRGYATLTEVRAALRPHLLESASWERLRDAAGAWEAARREARPLLSAAVRAQGEEFRRLSDLYDAAATAANNAYRAQHGQADGTGSAAA